ncbi:sugar kinase [Actinomadura sp. NBRC 104425]|uniref:ROK family protein n=1 Tax=Actinomadura sp. NBRC 104425 TaxID=3032204 RepID=UPI0024A4E98B|nr:ROK family protein [Actinomadura sp. NBRC 104425]GLZ10042.1 sugar kinase [Actinomadura sp. NBRC 104425]
MTEPMTEPAVLAVDIGGTKIAAAVVDGGGRILAQGRTPTLADESPEVLWKALTDLLDQVHAAAGGPSPAGVGVGCSGPMTWPDAEVSPLNIPAWRGFPLRRRLRERYPGLPVRVHNDAVCVAVGEHWRGAGRGHRNVLGMVVSTGVGGGLVLGGRLVDGASGNAGHVGHIVVEPGGPPCPCGGRGCLEAVASGPSLVRWARGEGWRPDEPAATGADLAADALAGNRLALAAVRRAGRAVGVALASATHLCDLDAAVIGGGVSQIGAPLFDAVREALGVHARMDFARRLRVVPTALGQTSGLVGAAALVLAGDRYWTGG